MSEFERLVSLEAIGVTPHKIAIAATGEECAALAARFGLVEIAHLAASAELIVEGEFIAASGRVSALAIQCCVASGHPVDARIDEAFVIRFSSELATYENDEIALDGDDCDVMSHDGRAIDIGEAVAQTLALALDPFPRALDADVALAKAGVVREEEFVTGPFAVLKGLGSAPR
jgi:uncharacterized metal-binding protein YceD (DUF177 family)